ncbi:uncharacterized protein LOC117829270 isoform X2 [Notolabrus celidotus]|uniref:uncharacterized protein LOC117829270 isoform X2 n=1 Tax=Notolabrus celidotus TaxID=1203425 RepID=UPI00148F78DE|nr:uncharacterized protein LOC117829270 isoform X2 [Notolabrus celidotus]
MECEEKSHPRRPQCPHGSAMGRRNVDVNREECTNEKAQLTVVMKSKPRMSIKFSSCFCEDSEASDSDSVHAKVEASQKDMQRGKDKGTAAASTQMLSTKPKARTLVERRQRVDGDETASLRDQSPLPLLTLTGTISTEPKKTSAPQAKASVSAARQDEAPTQSRKPSVTSREGKKSQYHKDLRLQVEERKQQMERERRRNTADEQKHNDTMLHSMWGMPGSGAPNFHLGTMRRTMSLHRDGILPLEQVRDRGFYGTPFHRL